MNLAYSSWLIKKICLENVVGVRLLLEPLPSALSSAAKQDVRS